MVYLIENVTWLLVTNQGVGTENNKLVIYLQTPPKVFGYK